MSILKDYIAYARTHIQPKLSEEASQRLIQAYVGRKLKTLFVLLLALINRTADQKESISFTNNSQFFCPEILGY